MFQAERTTAGITWSLDGRRRQGVGPVFLLAKGGDVSVVCPAWENWTRSAATQPNIIQACNEGGPGGVCVCERVSMCGPTLR